MDYARLIYIVSSRGRFSSYRTSLHKHEHEWVKGKSKTRKRTKYERIYGGKYFPKNLSNHLKQQ